MTSNQVRNEVNPMNLSRSMARRRGENAERMVQLRR